MIDPLIAGLLQASDLPAGMVPATDVQEGTDYDIDDAAFMANDGIRIVSRTWGRDQGAGTSIVFDFRMQFATPEQASALSRVGHAHVVRGDDDRSDAPDRCARAWATRRTGSVATPRGTTGR